MALQYNKGILEKGNLLMKQYTPEELNKLSKEEIVALLMQSQKEAALFKERLEELQNGWNASGRKACSMRLRQNTTKKKMSRKLRKQLLCAPKGRAANWLMISRDSLRG